MATNTTASVPIGPNIPTTTGVGTAPAVPIAGLGGSPVPGITSTSATNVTNPIATTVGGTVPGATTNGLPTSNGISLVDGSHTLVGDFKDTYGAGTGTALANVLGGLGTATSNAVTATNSQINQQADLSRANIDSNLAAGGISRDSSTSALSHGDFESQLASTIASTDAGINLSEENTLISSLQAEGSAHGPDGSGWDTFFNVLGDVGSVAGSFVGAATGLSSIGGLSGLGSSIMHGD